MQMRREYKVECVTGQPKVNYRETLTARAPFNYTHKKQTGGQGQYGKLIGFLEPLSEEEQAAGETFIFENKIMGNTIPPEYHAGIEKGFKDATEKGIAGYPVVGMKVVVNDGAYHHVDSSEQAFRTCAQGAFREAFKNARPQVLEPVMAVQIEVPSGKWSLSSERRSERDSSVDDLCSLLLTRCFSCCSPLFSFLPQNFKVKWLR